ncbi:MAG: ATP synthase F1 subunit epsilon [Pirellulales bacterium]|nr:ATP synthase F1 subunit epsilon [Pirellulales bacterium]
MADYHHSSNPTAADRVLECIVVTPESTALKSPAQFIAVPLYDGELGIAPGHSPLIGRLGYGELRIEEGGRTRRLYVDGGFVQVANNQVAVLTNHAIPVENLDAAVAREQLQSARNRPANSPELMTLREGAQQQARAQLRMAQHAPAAAH